MSDLLTKYDNWLKDDSDVAALVLRQWLEPVEGKDAVIFPPTYAKPERMRDEDWTGYNIDRFEDGSSVCLIDSVGSQANRMEPIFMREKLEPIFKRFELESKELVPQVVIKIKTKNNKEDVDKLVHLLEAGHRAGDAIARFADKMEGDADGKALGELLWNAFKEWQDVGNAEPLARIAPTSLVFGAWDSRATQAKVPRIVRSVCRAYNVKPHHRSAQFNTPLHYVDEGVIDEDLDKGEGEKNPLSQEGFRHSPAAWAHGGIEVMGEIRRDMSLNLVGLRSLGVKRESGEKAEESAQRTMILRRYVLGLALVALTQRDDQMFNLREGCLLRITKSSPWMAVPFEGKAEEISISPKDALAFAAEAASAFGVQQFEKPFLFDNKKAEQWLKLEKKDRDKRRRNGPVIRQTLSK